MFVSRLEEQREVPEVVLGLQKKLLESGIEQDPYLQSIRRTARSRSNRRNLASNVSCNQLSQVLDRSKGKSREPRPIINLSALPKDDRKPIGVLKVKIDSDTEKSLAVFRDTDSLQTARQFGRDHNLSNNKIDEVKLMIEELQMNKRPGQQELISSNLSLSKAKPNVQQQRSGSKQSSLMNSKREPIGNSEAFQQFAANNPEPGFYDSFGRDSEEAKFSTIKKQQSQPQVKMARRAAPPISPPDQGSYEHVSIRSPATQNRRIEPPIFRSPPRIPVEKAPPPQERVPKSKPRIDLNFGGEYNIGHRRIKDSDYHFQFDERDLELSQVQRPVHQSTHQNVQVPPRHASSYHMPGQAAEETNPADRFYASPQGQRVQAQSKLVVGESVAQSAVKDQILDYLFKKIDLDRTGKIKSYEVNFSQLPKEVKYHLSILLSRLDGEDTSGTGFVSIDYHNFCKVIFSSGKLDQIKELMNSS